MNEQTKTNRPLQKLHLTILRRISRGKKIIMGVQLGMWRFSGDNRNLYADFLLDEMRQAGILTADNQVTASGELWLVVNS